MRPKERKPIPHEIRQPGDYYLQPNPVQSKGKLPTIEPFLKTGPTAHG